MLLVEVGLFSLLGWFVFWVFLVFSVIVCSKLIVTCYVVVLCWLYCFLSCWLVFNCVGLLICLWFRVFTYLSFCDFRLCWVWLCFRVCWFTVEICVVYGFRYLLDFVVGCCALINCCELILFVLLVAIDDGLVLYALDLDVLIVLVIIYYLK